MDTYFNLGKYSRAISTSSKDAQIWFTRGLNWCYGFNHEEGVKCFHKAIKIDPKCAMAHWGVAYGSGPFYNLPWRHFGDLELKKYTKLCYDHIQVAKSLIPHVSEFEADLINALSTRFQIDHSVTAEEFDQWDDDYSNSTRELYKKYPQDIDIMAIFAEAMMTRTPWRLWNIKLNEPAENSDVIEALDVLNKAIVLRNEQKLTQHPLILHLHIHATEMSSAPEQSLEAANILRTLCPDLGHMNHMPGHTYVLCGLYEEAKIASEKAIIADRLYLDYAGPYNFYTTARCHDLHLMMYTCMLLGQFEPAWEAAQEMCNTLSRDVLEVSDRPQLAITMEGYYSMAMHVLIRFGKWQEIIDTPMPDCPILYPVSTPMHHYAKGIAHAALGQFTEADDQRSSFYCSLKRVPKDRKFFNNLAIDVLAVAEKMLEGEVEYHKGNYEEAYGHLRESISRDDNLAYTEPWAWMHPPRHALGALLMEQGHYKEAEEVYRTDLGLINTLPRCQQHLDNVWSLHGLFECLRNRNEDKEIITISKKLSLAMLKTDIPITSSCCCRKHTENTLCFQN